MSGMVRRLFPAGMILVLVGLAGAVRGGDSEKNLTRVRQLDGLRLGVLAGTMLDTAANAAFDYTQIEYFDSREQQFVALYAGEIDAIIDDEPVARHLAKVKPDVRMLEGSLLDDNLAFAVRLDDTALCRELNDALRQLVADGTMAAAKQRWLGATDAATRRIPHIPPSESDRVLRVGVGSASPPLSYLDADGVVTGLDIELLERITARLDRVLVVEDIDLPQLIPALLENRVDVIGGCFSITPERQRLMRFTDSYYSGGISALVAKGK